MAPGLGESMNTLSWGKALYLEMKISDSI
jgi:hypothetical protein